MKRVAPSDIRPAKKGLLEVVWNSALSFLNLRQQQPQRLVQIGRATYTQQTAVDVQNTLQFLEIEHFINNTDAILSQHNSKPLKTALRKLQAENSVKDKNQDMQKSYQTKEQLLDKINTLILRQKIELSKQTNSKTLNAANAFLSRIPEEAFNEDLAFWQQLENLNLQNNRLMSLPSQIYKLRALKKLDITQNNIATLPAQMTELARLEEIRLPTDTDEYYNKQTPYLPSKHFMRTQETIDVCYTTIVPVSLPRKIRS